MEMEIIDRDVARKIGQKWYYTGVPCQNSHIDKRYVNTGICYECKRIRNKNCNARHPDTLHKISKKCYRNNKIKKIQYNQLWSERNRDKSNQIKYRWKHNHRDQYLKYSREYIVNKRKDPYKRLSMNISKAIWECLKKNKNNATWLLFVDFTIDELIPHLEKKFTPKMNWENYGKYWHVDHIKPLSWFNLSTEFKTAWALTNLQPLEATKNSSKSNRYIG